MEQGTPDALQSLTEQVKKLQETVTENNIILHSLQRRARVALLVSILKWVVIIGISFGSFYFIKPLLGNIFGVYTNLNLDSILDPQKHRSE